jgi:hypothetical protein
MRTRKWKTLAIIFTAATLVAVVSLVQATLNYTKFYETKLVLSYKDFKIFIKPDVIEVEGNFTLSNPSGYSGLELLSLGLEVNFVDNSTMIMLAEGGHTFERQLIEPYSSITFKISSTAGTGTEEGKLFIELASRGNIEFVITAHTFLATFLGPTVTELDPIKFTYPKQPQTNLP